MTLPPRVLLRNRREFWGVASIVPMTVGFHCLENKDIAFVGSRIHFSPPRILLVGQVVGGGDMYAAGFSCYID